MLPATTERRRMRHLDSMNKVISISSPLFKHIYEILDDMDKTLNRMEIDIRELEEREEKGEN